LSHPVEYTKQIKPGENQRWRSCRQFLKDFYLLQLVSELLLTSANSFFQSREDILTFSKSKFDEIFQGLGLD
jgi:hypothetical protein